MICDNCGGHTRRGDTYCPNCGMELLVSEYKPLQRKYIRGEYQEEHFLDEDVPNYEETAEYETGYDYEDSQGSSRWLSVFLILMIALFLGLISGFIMFSGGFQHLSSFNIG